ncbi:hypothetical protein [Methylotenera sp. 1P/1]|uniref:hypothetical protein n=1 Tax=Methylotenera sp. 1P/1 TaxID=1131551 RepID=UPI000366CEAD|nr:hypothetical protein [Methylotenera sp. 1P/1]
MSWLIDRLYDQYELPIARFAFQGTTNWMRALAILVDTNAFENNSLRAFYAGQARRAPNEEADTLAFECLLMALHNAASLAKLSDLDEPYSCVRSAIVSWYYSIYYASKAMIAATNGADPQSHSDTAKMFQSAIVDRGFVVSPFHFSIKDLTTANIDSQITRLRAGNNFDLNESPRNTAEALGGALSYLNGTAKYRQEEIEEKVRDTAQFRALGVTNFRTKAARALRDDKLSPAYVNFLLEAFRYRGKANYRDAIYLSYGADRTAALTQLTEDLATVSKAFINMSAHYISRRVVRGNWDSYADDINSNARFTLPIDLTLA